MGFYKELLLGRDAFVELRTKIRNLLSADPATSGGEVLCIDICPNTGGLLITGQYDSGQRTHLLTISEVDE